MEKETMIPLSTPDITEQEIQAVVAVLKTPQLSLGPVLAEFEEKFARYVGAKYAVAVNSGTSALHLAVRSLGIGANDAVITTPFSFIASANCIVYEQALPLFVDIEPVTYNISPDAIEEFLDTECTRPTGRGRVIHRGTGREVKAILVVHVFGHPCDMDRIGEIAGRYGLSIIEDACEAVGAEYRGAKTGVLGDVGVFAFYPNKQMTTGEGGMIVTNDRRIAGMCKSMRNQGRDADGGWLAHRLLGYNYRISDINCALGLAQLARLDDMLDRRDAVARLYNSLLDDLVTIPASVPGATRSWFVYVVALNGAGPDQESVLRELSRRGIGCNNYFPPIHLQPFYMESFGYRPGDFPVTENVARRTVALPLYNTLKDEEIRLVAATLREVLAMISGRQCERKGAYHERGTERVLPLQRTGGI